MDLNSAVQFSSDINWEHQDDIYKMINEFKIKTEGLGYYDQRMSYNTFHSDMEEELQAAYDETKRLEDDMRKIVIITEVLAEKVDEYQQKVADIGNEKDYQNAATDYMQENIDALLEKDKEKDAKLVQMDEENSRKERKIKKLDEVLRGMKGQIEDLEEQIELQKDEIIKKNEQLAEKDIEFDDKMRSLQDLIEYKDDHISELEESLKKMDERLELIEKERDSAERQIEQLQKDLDETKTNMAHYRTSCQTLNKEYNDLNESFLEMQEKYKVLMRKNNDALMKRMQSSSSLGSLENHLIDSDGERNNKDHQHEENEFQAETLDDELGELEGLNGDFDGKFVL
jgi:chromosome segregation protein